MHVLRLEVESPGENGENQANAELPGPDELHRALQVVLDAMQRERGDPYAYEVGLLLISDQEMRRINREGRGKDRATDVLSFPLQDLNGDPSFPVIEGSMPIGDVLIAVDTCARQAIEVGHSVRDEFYRLLVHGLLHLFGYDHETSEQDARRMRAREDELLAELGAAGY